MYLYNVTLIIEADQETAIVGAVRKFTGKDLDQRVRMLKMLDSQHEGATYCLQIEAINQQAVLEFQQGPLATLQSSLESDFPGKILYFESVMEYI